MRIVRIYHGGRDSAHRDRERALVRAGIDLALVIPAYWPGGQNEPVAESFEVLEVPVLRPGDVNRHRFADPGSAVDFIARLRPDVVDIHEEPFSSVVHQLLRRLPMNQSAVTYTAQNIDKRFPPPFAQWERQALGRVQGLYPCTRQAASVVVGKGFTGAVRILPLAPPPEITVGDQRPPHDEIRMLMVGRLVAEKGVLDAVRVLARVRRCCPATLLLVGAGPETATARRLAEHLGVSGSVEIEPWVGATELAEHYRDAQVVLTPSRSTRTWVEQFGRMVGEAQAAGAVVVGYASGSLPEVLGAAGVLVPEGDVAALARAVIELHERPQRWLDLRNSGLAIAAGRTWDSVAAGQIELYEQSLESSRVPRRSRPRRVSAAIRYGDPARIAGGGRPFALPILRRDNVATRLLGRAVDAAGPREDRPPSNRLRVVYIDHVARLSGGELALARLIAAMPEIDAHVVLGEHGPLVEVLRTAGATVEVLALNAGVRDTRRDRVGTGAGAVLSAVRTLCYTFRLTRRLRQLRPDIVHTNSLKAGYYGCLAARLAGRPVIWHVRDRIAEDYLPARVVRLTRFALRCLPDYVVSNSAETFRTCDMNQDGPGADHLIPARARGWRVIGGVISDPCSGSDSPAVRGDGLVITMVGRLAPWKGQDVFIRAFGSAFRHSPGVHARIIGSAMFGEEAYADSLRSLVDDLHLGDRIGLCGFTEQVAHELSRSDVLVHASTVPEPFGQVVVEGMAAGLPVVASDAGGPAEIITDGIDGLLIEPGNVDDLASAMRRLVENPGLREQLGRAARIRARDFSPEVISEKWYACYRDVANSRGSVPS